MRHQLKVEIQWVWSKIQEITTQGWLRAWLSAPTGQFAFSSSPKSSPASLGRGQMQRSPIEEEEEEGVRMLWDEASLGDPPLWHLPQQIRVKMKRICCLVTLQTTLSPSVPDPCSSFPPKLTAVDWRMKARHSFNTSTVFFLTKYVQILPVKHVTCLLKVIRSRGNGIKLFVSLYSLPYLWLARAGVSAQV